MDSGDGPKTVWTAPRPFRVTRGWVSVAPADLHLRSLISASTRGSYYSLLTHSSRSWIIYHLDTPLDTAQCCSREMVAFCPRRGTYCARSRAIINKTKSARKYILRITKHLFIYFLTNIGHLSCATYRIFGSVWHGCSWPDQLQPCLSGSSVYLATWSLLEIEGEFLQLSSDSKRKYFVLLRTIIYFRNLF